MFIETILEVMKDHSQHGNICPRIEAERAWIERTDESQADFERRLGEYIGGSEDGLYHHPLEVVGSNIFVNPRHYRRLVKGED